MIARYWVVAAAILILSASHIGAYRFGASVTQTRADLAASELAEQSAFALSFAQSAARGEERRQQADADRKQSEITQSLDQLQADYDRDAAVADGLREQIKRYDTASRSGSASGVPVSATRNENPGNLLAVVLDKCVSRVRELAKISDSRGIKRKGAEDFYNGVRSPASE